MNKTTLLANITATEAALTAVLASPGPSYSVSGPSGSRSVDKSSYIKMLTDELSTLQSLLMQIDPYRVSTKVVI